MAFLGAIGVIFTLVYFSWIHGGSVYEGAKSCISKYLEEMNMDEVVLFNSGIKRSVSDRVDKTKFEFLVVDWSGFDLYMVVSEVRGSSRAIYIQREGVIVSSCGK